MEKTSNGNGIMIGLTMVAVFALGIFLGYYFGSAGSGSGTNSVVGSNSQSAQNADGTTNSDATDTSNGETAVSDVPEEGVKIDASTMSDGQRKMLELLGVDTNNITLTPAMVACAEAEVGAARLVEIQNGASPSFTEGARLVACYK